MQPHHPRSASPARSIERTAPARLLAPLPCDWLFSASAEPVLIVDAATQRIVEANPPAAELVGIARAQLVETPFAAAFDSVHLAVIHGSFTVAQSTGTAQTTSVRARRSRIEMSARLSLLRAPPQSYLLVRLAPGAATRRVPGGRESEVFHAIDSSPVAFLMTDALFRIDYANRVFIDLVHAAPYDGVRGTSLTRWLKLNDADLSSFQAQLSQRRAVSTLTTHLRSACAIADARGRPGNLRRVDLCAVAVPDGPRTCWGFSVRELPRLN